MLRISRRRGFTLIEIAIVLGIVGVLGVGLWRLFSSSSQQMGDQGAASQQTQLIGAVKGFLASNYGQSYMSSNNVAGGCGGTCGPNSDFSLPLPTSNTSLANCQSTYGDNNLKQFCTFLPAGFYNQTINSYGQTYGIQILRDNTANPLGTTPPNTYSFMIATFSGTIIPDTSGGRLASLIGNDGGFIYTNSVCGAPVKEMACGAYGAWSVDTRTAYGFTGASATASGHIASRTFVSPEQSSQQPWLARNQLDPNYYYNTMTTNMLLGGNPLYMAATVGATSGGGTINLQGGQISDPNPGKPGSVNITFTGAGFDTTNNYNPMIALSTGCTQDANAGGSGLPLDPKCQYGMQISGDASFAAGVSVYDLYATGFLYGQLAPPSDMRLKTDIRPIAHPLEDLDRLKPVAFTFKRSGRHDFGVIAQDLEKVYPELVVNGPEGYKSVIYDGLIGPLIGAVQELKQQNDQLRQQVREQTLREDELERELHARVTK